MESFRFVVNRGSYVCEGDAFLSEGFRYLRGKVFDSIWNMVRALSDFSLSITVSICAFAGSVGVRVVDSKSTPAKSTYLV